MTLMGRITIGSSVTITFEADVTNSGHSDLTTGFVPEEAGEEINILIRPGQTEEILYDSVPESEQLNIHLKLPFSGNGILTVKENDEVKDSELVNEDTVWDYLMKDDLSTGILADHEEE